MAGAYHPSHGLQARRLLERHRYGSLEPCRRWGEIVLLLICDALFAQLVNGAMLLWKGMLDCPWRQIRLYIWEELKRECCVRVDVSMFESIRGQLTKTQDRVVFIYPLENAPVAAWAGWPLSTRCSADIESCHPVRAAHVQVTQKTNQYLIARSKDDPLRPTAVRSPCQQCSHNLSTIPPSRLHKKSIAVECPMLRAPGKKQRCCRQ